MTIGEAAKRAGVNVQTIRYYERTGLVPRAHRLPDSGYRDFPEDTVQLLRFIKTAQRLGFTLREIKELVDLNIEPESACDEVIALIEGKLTDLDEKMAAMQDMKKVLNRMVRQCAQRSPSLSCPVLQALAETGI